MELVSFLLSDSLRSYTKSTCRPKFSYMTQRQTGISRNTCFVPQSRKRSPARSVCPPAFLFFLHKKFPFNSLVKNPRSLLLYRSLNCRQSPLSFILLCTPRQGQWPSPICKFLGDAGLDLALFSLTHTLDTLGYPKLLVHFLVGVLNMMNVYKLFKIKIIT